MTSPDDRFAPAASSPFEDSSPLDSSPSGGGGSGAAADGGGEVSPSPEPSDMLDDLVILEPGPTAHELGLELPEDPGEAQALLLRELSEARQEAGEQLEMLQRVAADFDN